MTRSLQRLLSVWKVELAFPRPFNAYLVFETTSRMSWKQNFLGTTLGTGVGLYSPRIDLTIAFDLVIQTAVMKTRLDVNRNVQLSYGNILEGVGGMSEGKCIFPKSER